MENILPTGPEKTSPEERDAEPVNILIVDDLPEKLLIYKVILEELGENLIFARSGEEALKLLLKHDFAVILLDVNMPGMDGLETAAMIRKRRKSENVPIIFLTAFADDVHAARGYASGAVDFLMTPVMPEILKAKVRVFIDISRMRRRAERQAEEVARRKAAEELDRRKDAFIGMLAHELRNPLGPIRNAVHLLRESGTETPQLAPLCDIIDRQTLHMARLVDDLLDTTRLASGKVQLRRERCDLAHLVRQTVEDYRDTFARVNLEVETDLPDAPVWVEGDPVRLVQMVGNLLHNAQKFTNPGGRVVVRLARDGAAAAITVADTGIGIDAAMLPHIFEVFQQAEQGLDRRRGGLGLGLALVNGLAELHGGSVRAESDGLGKGAKFTLRIPAEAAAVSVKVAADRESAAAPVPRRRILIIEDSYDASETSRMILAREGHDVRVASDGKAGIAAAQEFHPQVILCDIGLPGIDGYQVARALRQDPKLAGVYMVALTGYGRESDRKLAREAGFDQHMTKPIDFSVLRNALSAASGA